MTFAKKRDEEIKEMRATSWRVVDEEGKIRLITSYASHRVDKTGNGFRLFQRVISSRASHPRGMLFTGRKALRFCVQIHSQKESAQLMLGIWYSEYPNCL